MAAQVTVEQHVKLIKGTAWKVYRRLEAAGVRGLNVADIEQEFWIAWCYARDSWDPKHNVPFGAYLVRGMRQHINRWADRECRHFLTAPVDLDAEISDDDTTRHDLLADTKTAGPDTVLIEKDQRDYIQDPLRWRNGMNKLSERARQFIQLLDNPPAEIVEIFRALRARAEYARQRGVTAVAAPQSITSSLVMDIMGCNRLERASIYAEIRDLIEEVNQQ